MLALLHDTTAGRREIYINPRYVSTIKEKFGKTEITVNAGDNFTEIQVSESVREAGVALNKAAQSAE